MKKRINYGGILVACALTYFLSACETVYVKSLSEEQIQVIADTTYASKVPLIIQEEKERCQSDYLYNLQSKVRKILIEEGVLEEEEAKKATK